MYLLQFYVEKSFLQAVKEAVFSAGGGAYGGFKRCAWETLGGGQYQPQGQDLVEQPEYKVEILCEVSCREAVIQAFKQAHPCDKPVFYFTQITDSIMMAGHKA